MKRSILGFITLCLPTALGFAGEQGRTSQGRGKPPVSEVQLLPSVEAIDLRAFTEEVEDIERELAEAIGFSRDDLLAMYGRSSAASGQFDRAATAYAMFLNEFGLSHPNSERVTMQLANALFPFKFDSIDVIHLPSGPRIEPQWRMGYPPRPEHLRLAVRAFELAASIARDQQAKGSALLKLGWVHRVLGDWESSTRTWDRCANEAVSTKSAADALWLAAENLEWTNCPTEAAEHLQRLCRDYPDDARTPAAMDRIEHLQAEASRSADWLSDPVTSLIAEIESRASARSPFEVYRSVVRWLQWRGEREALITVSRWACDQDDWPITDRITCRFDLTEALLQEGDQGLRDEAVRRLQEVVELAPDDDIVVYATIRGCRVLNQLERFDEAERMAGAIVDRVKNPKQAEPIVLADLAETFLKSGERERALWMMKKLKAAYPEYGVSDDLEALQHGDRTESRR